MNAEVVQQPKIGQNSCESSRALCWLALATPFFLGAALYLSVVLAFFSALPIVFALLRHGRFKGYLAGFTNLAIVFAVSGRVSAAIFFVIGIVLAISISEGIKIRLRFEWLVTFAVGVMMLAATGLLVSYSMRNHLNPFQKLDSFVATVVNEVANNVEKYRGTSTISSQDLEKFVVDPEMTKRNILFELPSSVIIGLLVLTVGNLLMTMRLNLAGIRDQLKLPVDFFRYWKVPEKLVWPTLAAAFCLVVEISFLNITDIALNLFKVLMAIYALQGLAIVNWLFDSWNVRGFLRPLGYFLSVAILLPLVISLGFFDLWANFRQKLQE